MVTTQESRKTHSFIGQAEIEKLMPPSFDSSKPLAALRAVAASLGWRGLELWQRVFDDGRVVTWYSTSDRKFFLQINEHPIGQVETYAAAVYADRYGICTGWHRFRLGDGATTAALASWLRRPQFKDRRWRREFQLQHPECCLCRPTPRRCRTARLTGVWPPYFPDDRIPSPVSAVL